MRDVEYLFKYIDSARDSILEAIESLTSLKDDIKDFSGKVTQVIPGQLEVTINSLIKVINGSEQNSLDSLENYLDSVPIVELRDKSTIDVLNKNKAEPSTDVTLNDRAVASDDEGPVSSVTPTLARESMNRWHALPELKEDLEDDFEYDLGSDDDLSYDITDIDYSDALPEDEEDTDLGIWDAVNNDSYFDNSDASVGGVLPEDSFAYEEPEDDFIGSDVDDMLTNEVSEEWKDFQESYKK